MKIFISSDIEGTNGIAAWEEADKSKGDYGYFAAKMTKEVAAVCEGISSFDPQSDILVKDAHATGRNIDHAALPRNTRLNRGWAGAPASMINCMDSSFDGAVFTGYHSPAYCGGNPLAHTINSSRIAKITINGILASEFVINYFAALSQGVPLIMVSGDKCLMEQVNALDADIVTVATVEGYGGSSTSVHPAETLEALREGAKKAASLAPALKSKVSGKLPQSFDIEVVFKRHMDAFKAAYFPGAYAADAFTVGYKCTGFFDFLKAWMFF